MPFNRGLIFKENFLKISRGENKSELGLNARCAKLPAKHSTAKYLLKNAVKRFSRALCAAAAKTRPVNHTSATNIFQVLSNNISHCSKF